MAALDGNESLKRLAQIGDRQVGDERTFEASDYYLSTSFVDSFADQVKSKRTKDPPECDMADDENDDSGDDKPEDDVRASGCTDNWKAAGPDHKKQAWGIFHENGIFASACRHALILWIADMVRSGEQ